MNRPASRPSHDGAVKYMYRAVSFAFSSGFRKARLRGDTDFSLTVHFDRWDAQGVEFVFGIDAHKSFVQMADRIEEKSWKRLTRGPKWEVKTKPRQRPTNVREKLVREKGYKNFRLKEEHIAEVEYQPSKSEGKYRMIVLRKTILVEEGQDLLFTKTRYFFYVTNLPASALSKEEVVRQSNARQETAMCTSRATAVQIQASRERLAEITSGRAFSQQGLAATCKDPSIVATSRRGWEGEGLAHESV